MKGIKAELVHTLADFRAKGKLLEAQRLEQRTTFDLEMIEATGSCAGIENYSRWLTGRKPGEPPPTLFEYLPDNALVFCRRKPCQRAADRRHVQRRLSPQVHPGRIRLPPAVLHRQPPAEVRGMGRDAAAVGLCQRHARQLGDGTHRRHLHRTGDPAHRTDRSAGGNPPGGKPGRRSDRRMPSDRQARLSRLGHHPDQEDGGRPDRIYARTGHPRALHALRCRDPGAHRDHPRSAAGRLRRADRHQPAARGPGHSRMRPGRHSGRRQGRLPAQRDLADPDHRPRRPQCGRQGDPLCRPHHRLDGAGDGGDQPPPRQAGSLQRRTRHHAGQRQAQHRRHHGLDV